MSHVFGSIALDHIEDLELDGWFRLTCAGENTYLVQIGSTVLTVEHDGVGDEDGPWRVRVTKIKKGAVRPFTYWPKDLSVMREWQEDGKPKAKRHRAKKTRSK